MADQVTPELMQRAWHELAKEDWGDLEVLRRDYMRFGLVRARAIDLARGRPPAPPPPAAAPTKASSLIGSLKVSHPEPLHDRKSAAAGEREDD